MSELCRSEPRKDLNRPQIRTKISAVPRGSAKLAVVKRLTWFPEPLKFNQVGLNPARSTNTPSLLRPINSGGRSPLLDPDYLVRLVRLLKSFDII